MSKDKYKVIGELRVAGAGKGETVTLDDAEVNVVALLSGRLIEAIPEPTPRRAKPAKDGE